MNLHWNISSRRTALACIIFACLSILSLASGVQDNNLQVHWIPHSHCDPGWLRTYHEYYQSQVRRILDNVVSKLASDRTKTFIWAEISFFKLWWDEQDANKQELFRKLVENKQFEFVGGGWVQNDEAAASLEGVINQITEGHEYILKLFGVRPRIAWQIDPFGHSSLTPTLFKQFGYEALVINRIHFQLKSQFKQNRNMEFIWRASPSLGESADMFTHVLHTHYSAPMGYDWEEGSGRTVTASNVGNRARELCDTLKGRSMAYKTKHLLVTWGDDFKFQNAEKQFQQMDMIIEEINKNPGYGCTIQYSTLSRYFDAVAEYVAAKDIQFAVIKDDFFPYADNENSYWTGYYTTRPFLKSLHRYSLAQLRSGEALYALGRIKYQDMLDVDRENILQLPVHVDADYDAMFKNLLEARWNIALVNHHDGITGTSKQRVAGDYISGMNIAVQNIQQVMSKTATILLSKGDHYPAFAGTPVTILEFNSNLPTAVVVCHNSLGWTRTQVMTVLVSDSAVQVRDSEGVLVPSQIIPVWSRNQGNLQEDSNLDQFYLCFTVDVPAFGLKTYFVSKSKTETAELSTTTLFAPKIGPAQKKFRLIGSSEISIENKFIKVSFDKMGRISSVYDKVTKQTRKLSMEYHEYETRSSGAYLFRTGKDADPIKPQDQHHRIHVITGRTVQEVQVYSTPQQSHVVRLYNSDDPLVGKFIEIRHSVSPSNKNRELTVRYATDVKSDKTFYTDNGMQEMRERQRRNTKREENYYPVQQAAVIRDDTTQFTVLIRQSEGATSVKPGELELMLHRSLNQDDERGLAEAVVDSTVVSITHWLMLDSVQLSEQLRPRLSLLLENGIKMIFARTKQTVDEWLQDFNAVYDPFKDDLPANVHLMSFRARDANSDDVMIRFFHIFESSNKHNEQLSSETKIGLDKLFERHSIKSVRAVSISGIHEPSIGSNVVYKKGEVVGLEIDPQQGVDDQDRQNSPEKGVFLSKNALDLMKNNSDRQNSNEKGVFLSKNALDLNQQEDAAKKAPAQRLPLSVSEVSVQRKLLELPVVNNNFQVESISISPIQILSVLMQIRPQGWVDKAVEVNLEHKIMGQLPEDQGGGGQLADNANGDNEARKKFEQQQKERQAWIKAIDAEGGKNKDKIDQQLIEQVENAPPQEIVNLIQNKRSSQLPKIPPQGAMDPLYKNYISSKEIRFMLIVTSLGVVLILATFLQLNQAKKRSPPAQQLKPLNVNSKATPVKESVD